MIKNPIIEKIKIVLNKVFNVINAIVITVLVSGAVITVFSIISASMRGEEPYFLGYKPIFVMTGSMEPYMMTNGTVIVKKVENPEKEIKVGDVVNYHLEVPEENKTIKVTHRVISIDKEKGTYQTKGDNNKLKDTYPITAENIDAKVVATLNWTAWIADQWKTTQGKIFLICGGLFFLVLIIFIETLFSPDTKSQKNDKTGDNLVIFDEDYVNLREVLYSKGYNIHQLVDLIKNNAIELPTIDENDPDILLLDEKAELHNEDEENEDKNI